MKSNSVNLFCTVKINKKYQTFSVVKKKTEIIVHILCATKCC